MRLSAAAIGFFLSACAFSQARFDVASVKPSNLFNPSGEVNRRERIVATPGSLSMYNVSLSSAIQWAYNVRDYQVSGPGWINDQRYEIIAKAGEPVGDDQLRVMLQALLADRLNVSLHHEKKELTVYALTVAKGGLKMKPGNPDGKSVLQGDKTTLNAQDTSIGEIAEMLSRFSRSFPGVPPVIDMTGLSGRYNFTVDASAFFTGVEEGGKGAGLKSSIDPADPSGFIAQVQEILEKQLGLHSELRKAPADVLVVERADKIPTAN